MAATVISEPLPSAPAHLSASINAKIHLLATEGDDKLAENALNAAKSLFDLGLSLEPFSHPHLHRFLESLSDQGSAIATRSGGSKSQQPKSAAADEMLPYTPLSGLTVDGLDADQVWEQLELRAKNIGQAVAHVGEGNKPDFDEDDDEENSQGSESSDRDGGSDDEEMTLEEYERMVAENGGEFDSDSEKESEDEDGSASESGSGSGDEDDEVNFFDEEDTEGLEGHSGSDDEGMDDDDELEGLEGSDDEEEEEEDEDAPSAISEPSSSRTRKHPELDDSFFSIDAFNKQTEQAEAGRVTSGRLGGDGDDDDEEEEGLGDMAGMLLDDLGAPNDDDTVMYSDFFPPPREEYVRPPRGSGKEKDAQKAKATKAGKKGKGLSFGDDDLDVDMDAEGDEDDVERDVMGRVKGDLFADDDDAEVAEAEKNLSTHEKRQLALRAQIAQLEQDIVGPKDWTLLGEASSRARPENSLLEENLEFEQVGKVVPVITEESVKSLEDMIKARIRDNNFNSPIRVRPMDTKPFLPSRLFEIEDQQSAKSLAQIYEDEYQTAATGGKKRDARDDKLSKDHEEIESLWGEICYKLDALSSAHFVPKAPNAKITTVSNVATTSMETALPSMNSASTMLAPEELFAPPTAGELRAKSEMMPEEKQKARQANRKRKQGQVKRLGDAVVNFGKKEPKGAKAEKERALAGLVKTGKGVTVVGKGGGVETSKRKRGEPTREDAKRLKL